MHIKRFLELSGEFVNTQVDNYNIENSQDAEDSEEGIAENMKYKIPCEGRIYCN